MRNKRAIATMMIAIMSVVTIFSLSGCGGSDDSAKTLSIGRNSDKSYLNGLEDGKIYVRHDNTFTEVYFNNTTFEKESVVASPKDGRIYWFQGDEDKIPTLYKGDSLVEYTSGVFEEKFILERFEDLGYSVGICGMQPIESGRYTISTDVEKKNTYPYSDADEITKLTNPTVIVDSISEKPIREYNEVDPETYEPLAPPQELCVPTKHGTIPGLKKDSFYNVRVYEGTVEHLYKLCANVMILASMECLTKIDYKFEEEYLLKIELPSTLKTGYYSINGLGVFRYVADSTYNANTNFNEPNEPEDSTLSAKPKNKTEIANENYELDLNRENVVAGTQEERNAIQTQADAMLSPKTPEELMYTEPKVYTLNITGDGYFEVKVALTGAEDAKSFVTGIITDPTGKNTKLQRDKNGDLSTELAADIDGKYIIRLYDMSDRVSAKIISKQVSDPEPVPMDEEYEDEE